MCESPDTPSDFRRVVLGEVAKVEMGQSPDSQYVSDELEYGIPFLQGNAEFGPIHPLPKFRCTQPTKRAPKNAVLISVRAPVGAVNLADQEYCIGRGLAGLSFPNMPTSIAGKIVASRASALRRVAQGTTFEAINKKDLTTLKLCLPPNNELATLARILDTLDTAIQQTEAILEKLKAVKQGLLHDLLTRGIDANGQLRPPQCEAPHLYKESPLGWIPKEWEVEKLCRIAEIIDPQPDHRTPKELEFGAPFIGIGDVTKDSRIDYSSCRKVVWSALEKQEKRFTINAGDIIFGKIGTIGQPKQLPSGRFALTANVLLIKPLTGTSYVFHLLGSPQFLKQISDITNTTSQPALGIETVRELHVACAPIGEQKTISEQLDSVIFTHSREFGMLEKLKKQKIALMDDLLTGRVRVTPLLENAA